MKMGKIIQEHKKKVKEKEEIKKYIEENEDCSLKDIVEYFEGEYTKEEILNEINNMIASDELKFELKNKNPKLIEEDGLIYLKQIKADLKQIKKDMKEDKIFGFNTGILS